MGDLFDFSWDNTAFILIRLLWWLKLRIFPSTGARLQDAGPDSGKYFDALGNKKKNSA